jgi:long-chain acyl-CoA synthetase
MPAAMMTTTPIDTIFQRLRLRGESPALWERDREISCRELLEHVDEVENRLRAQGVGVGCVVGFCGDYGLCNVAAFLALFRIGAIAVPLSPAAMAQKEELAAEAQIELWLDTQTCSTTRTRETAADHPLIQTLRAQRHPGLIVFTSGSSGRPKAILHDVNRVASKFLVQRPGWRMVLFLLIDHFGGFNTLLACLAYGGTGICVASRTPDDVCDAIARGRADLLPTTPTFLSLLIASNAWRRHDLSSVRLVTYGAEPMPESTLRRLPQLFPNADLKQTYGLSELGVLQSASPQKGSLWLRVGGKDFETRVVDGTLRIRSGSSMLGYLNAPNPIDADGWMNTGDLVEERDGLIRVVGRASDVINVGGQKVYPVEVESILQEHDKVAEATVYAVRHPVLGQVVGARVSLHDGCDPAAALAEIKAHCRARLQKYKIPMRFEVVEMHEHGNDRGKKVRR